MSIPVMSCWYKRFEIQKRFSGFYALGLLCGGLSSLIGEAVLNLNHARGYLAWRWLYIIVWILVPSLSLKPDMMCRKEQ